MTSFRRLAFTLVNMIAVVACAGDERARYETPGEVSEFLGSARVGIGLDETQPGHVLHAVTGALRTSDGRIVVANEGTRQLRVFDGDGALLSEAGRQGAGPDEFMSMQAIHPFGADSVIVWDLLAMRLSVWSNAGEFGRTVRVSMEAVPVMMGQLGTGRSVFTVQHPSTGRSAVAFDPYTDSVEAVIVGSSGSVRHSIGVFGASRKVLADASDFGGPARVQVPLPDGPALAVATSEDRIYVGFPDGSPVEVFDRAGHLLARIAAPTEPRPRPSAAAEAAIEEQLNAVDEIPRARYRRYLERFPQPDRYPAYDLLLVDDRGELWFRHYPARNADWARWIVVDTMGAFVREHQLPVRFEPLQIGLDWILGMWEGENGVTSVLVAGLDAGS